MSIYATVGRFSLTSCRKINEAGRDFLIWHKPCQRIYSVTKGFSFFAHDVTPQMDSQALKSPPQKKNPVKQKVTTVL